MKKKLIIETLLVVVGFALIAYPIFSNYINLYNQSSVISNYQDTIDNLNDNEIDEQIRRAQKYNKELEKDSIVDLSLKENEKEVENYLNILSVGGIIGNISIPKIDVYLPIYHGVSDEVLRKGVGHIENTSFPVGGIGTHSVLAGHTGLRRMKVFDDINKLDIGDKFYIDVLGKTLVYEVDNIKVVDPDDTSAIKIENDKDYITLVTCTPRILNTHRLLVRGIRVELTTDSNIDTNNTNKKDTEKIQSNTVESIQDVKNKNKKKIYIRGAIFLIVVVLFLIIFFKKGIYENT